MFVTAVCFLFLLKLKWPKNKNIYDATELSLYLEVVNDARIHSSLKRKDFVKWPTYISVFRRKDLWSFVDAYCLICFPA